MPKMTCQLEQISFFIDNQQSHRNTFNAKFKQEHVFKKKVTFENYGYHSLSCLETKIYHSQGLLLHAYFANPDAAYNAVKNLAGEKQAAQCFTTIE